MKFATSPNKKIPEQKSQDPELLELLDSRAELLTDLLLTLNRSVMLNLAPRLKKLGLNFGRYHLLEELVETDKLAMKEVADRLAITSAAATGVGDKLVDKGLADRIPNPTGDRRSEALTLSVEGSRLMDEFREAIRELIAAKMAEDEGFPERDQIAAMEGMPSRGS